MSQSESDGHISKNCKLAMDRIFKQFPIEHVVIELQLGQYSCTSIQLLLVSAIPDDMAFTVQHSKLKLKFKEMAGLKSQNPDSKQYNQNKQMGRQLALLFYPELSDKSLSFDEFDAILHGRYCIENESSIKWIKKVDLI